MFDNPFDSPQTRQSKRDYPLIGKFMEAAQSVELQSSDEFEVSAFAMLALAISKLPYAKREEMLLAIECGGLRRAVADFPTPEDKSN